MFNLHDVTPRKETAQFEHVVNTLAVKTESGWAYFPMRVSKDIINNYLFVEKAPKVLADGVLALAGKTYLDVTMKDLVRRRVDVRKLSQHPDIPANVATSTPVNQSGTSQEDWDRECKEADLAYAEQVAALQNSQNF